MKPPLVKMIALKAIRYKIPKIVQDRIAIGDVFYVQKKHVKALVGLRHAKVAPRDPVSLPEIPPSLVAKVSGAPVAANDDLKDLREQYMSIFGKRPFNGWDAATLRAKIDEHMPSVSA